MDPSFTDPEKRFVLAEMIKVSQMDIAVLVDFVKSHDVQPDWLSMQLPNGRNVNQCVRAARDMGMLHLQPPIVPAAPLKRKSVGEPAEPAPNNKRLAMTPIEPQPASFHPRIQPRPSPNGYAMPAPPVSSPTVPPAIIPRKRGRPSRADREAQLRANASAGFGHPVPLAPHPTPPPPPRPPPLSLLREEILNGPPTFLAPPSPPVARPKRKAERSLSTDTTQLRRLPEHPLSQAEKKPSLGNIMSPIGTPIFQRDGPAVAESERRDPGGSAHSQPGAPPAPISLRNDDRASRPPVNTRA